MIINYRDCRIEISVLQKDPDGKTYYKMFLKTNKKIHDIPIIYDPNLSGSTTSAATYMKMMVDDQINDDLKDSQLNLPLAIGWC